MPQSQCPWSPNTVSKPGHVQATDSKWGRLGMNVHRTITGRQSPHFQLLGCTGECGPGSFPTVQVLPRINHINTQLLASHLLCKTNRSGRTYLLITLHPRKSSLFVPPLPLRAPRTLVVKPFLVERLEHTTPQPFAEYPPVFKPLQGCLTTTRKSPSNMSTLLLRRRSWALTVTFTVD